MIAVSYLRLSALISVNLRLTEAFDGYNIRPVRAFDCSEYAVVTSETIPTLFTECSHRADNIAIPDLSIYILRPTLCRYSFFIKTYDCLGDLKFSCHVDDALNTVF